MLRNIPGWMVGGQFICLYHIKPNEVPKKGGFIPAKEAPRPGWCVKPESECSRHKAGEHDIEVIAKPNGHRPRRRTGAA